MGLKDKKYMKVLMIQPNVTKQLVTHVGADLCPQELKTAFLNCNHDDDHISDQN